MNITAISDTHGKHKQLDLDGGDLLIHAGDIEARNGWDLRNFCKWFEKQDYKHKIFVAGNHDFYLQRPDCRDIIDNHDIIYIQDFQIEIEGIKIWGSPWSLPFMNWAFMKPENGLNDIYEQIPEDTDIVINHGAPKHILDRTVSGIHTGIEFLVEHVVRVSPDYCIFGHIHECYGTAKHLGTQYINASVLDENYNLVNKPHRFEYSNSR